MNILLIEQERSLLTALERWLTKHNHNVQVAFDGVIAVNNFSEDIDIIIIDENIPRISFSETISLLNERKEGLKSIVLTNNFIIPTSYLLDSNHIDAYITRPFFADSFLEIINDLEKNTYKEPFTYYENKFITALKDGQLLSYEGVKEIFKEQINSLDNYISSLNKKMKDKEIVHDEKGFKLVNKND